MAKQLQLRRGTTAQHSTFTGAVGEVTIDTDKDVVVVHDGSTAGGFPSQKQLFSGTNIKTINDTSILGSGNISVQPTLESGTNIKTINNASILGSGNLNVISAGIITGGTTNQVLAKNSNTDYDTKWYSVQEPLVSGANIKTVNSTSILGSGDISISSYTDADALSLFNAGGSAPVYACRAWVNFNGTGTVAIRGSGNVSSVTDNGVGNYSVNFSTSMPDVNYSWSINGRYYGGTGGFIATDGTILTSSIKILCVNAAMSANFDNDNISITIFR